MSPGEDKPRYWPARSARQAMHSRGAGTRDQQRYVVAGSNTIGNWSTSPWPYPLLLGTSRHRVIHPGKSEPQLSGALRTITCPTAHVTQKLTLTPRLS